MNEELKEKLENQKFEQSNTVKEVEKIIDLINDSNTLDLQTRTKVTAFLEGYRTASKEQVEWLQWILQQLLS